jgi:cytochrome c-type biogenesis protein
MTQAPRGTARDRVRAELSESARQPAPSFHFAVLGAAGGLLLVGLVGWLAWNQGALVGLRWVEFDSPVTLAAFGFVAGVGAFFAPCAFALFPGYISYYVASTGTRREGPGRSLVLGLSCAAGSTFFFALTGVAITLVGGAISPYLIATKPVIAVAVVLLGVVLLADVRLPSLGVPLGGLAARLPAASAVFLYGFGYALASTGCTLPIYVSIIVLPLTSGFAGAALLTFASFALAMALMMLLTSVLVGLAKASLLRRLQASTAWIKRASGAVLIAAGLYLGYYYVAAGM